MAAYEGTSHLYLDGDLALSDFVPGEIVTDDGGDTVFSPGETVGDTSDSFADGSGTFVGTINIEGTDYPIFSDANTGGTLDDYTLYVVTPSGFDSSTLPENLDSATDSSLAECFLEGTAITTPQGSVRVEELRIGDAILTADGESVPVRWVGRQKVVCAFHPPERLMPIRVCAGALGDGLPLRDLLVTANHALMVDGLLLNASALVNDTSIEWVPLIELGKGYTVYHIETENHSLILAEGVPAETYIDYVSRSSFDNYDEYLNLYGMDITIPEMALSRISASRYVPLRVLQRLASAKVA
ncbi:Hint domain-containing protein [Salinicola corii]|uniref:Hint domain-containing protein n=1 Tax=Salinicola corii TaxID=2606937 RepID=A0A640WBL1_9GAMM|nr:Hint domain-containing protein [Salinicola corii]KAA0016825.1 Hint domain-containing protein [Salinicola corii]